MRPRGWYSFSRFLRSSFSRRCAVVGVVRIHGNIRRLSILLRYTVVHRAFPFHPLACYASPFLAKMSRLVMVKGQKHKKHRMMFLLVRSAAARTSPTSPIACKSFSGTSNHSLELEKGGYIPVDEILFVSVHPAAYSSYEKAHAARVRFPGDMVYFFIPSALNLHPRFRRSFKHSFDTRNKCDAAGASRVLMVHSGGCPHDLHRLPFQFLSLNTSISAFSDVSQILWATQWLDEFADSLDYTFPLINFAAQL